MASVPTSIAAADPRVVRPVDLRDVYANPSKELARLTEAGALLHLAHGYYAVVPETYRATRWRPPIEAVGLGIAQADYGRDGAAVMGPSAARLLESLPRALGMSVVATGKQRPTLRTTVGRVRFVTRDLDGLDLQRADTVLATGWVTTPEQTILDLADRPELGGLPAADVAEAIRALAAKANWERIGELAENQRKRPAAVRAAWVAGVEPPVRVSRPVRGEGLTGARDADPDAYGIA